MESLLLVALSSGPKERAAMFASMLNVDECQLLALMNGDIFHEYEQVCDNYADKIMNQSSELEDALAWIDKLELELKNANENLENMKHRHTLQMAQMMINHRETLRIYEHDIIDLRQQLKKK